MSDAAACEGDGYLQDCPLDRRRMSGRMAGSSVFQDRWLYFPEKTTVAKVASQSLRAWPASDEVRGFVATPTGPVRGTAIVFHGNAGHAGHRAYYAAVLTALGFRVILAEYPGYGPREGQLGEQHLVDDAEQTVDRAYGMYRSPLLIVGESLGAGVAAAISSRQHDKISGLILLTPWDRLATVAAYHFPWLPVRWLLRDRYDNVANLASCDRPVLVAVAERDNVVPARFGTALYDSLPARKRLKIVTGSDHNDWQGRVDLDWWADAAQFIVGTPAGPDVG
jgi:pimeloyl-ACP methyl ester carboxylesterase